MKEKQKSKVLVLGNFGYANHDLSGQTVKTRVIRELLAKHYSPEKVDYFDTQTLKKKSNIFVLLKKIVLCDYAVYLPAHGNLKYLFPVYFVFSHIFRFKIIYSVIGGWLVPYLKDKPMHRYMLKHIYVILAETTLMKEELEKEYGFKNVDLLYNFRLTDYQPKINSHGIFKIVFMARIDPNKGLDTIFNFCDHISKMNPIPEISVDFYGPMSPFINEREFEDCVGQFNFVHYHGALEPDAINETLNNYDLLVLPTHYYTEGLPGTIIDAYISGIPVVVSEWRHAREFVDDCVSGIIVPFDNNQEDFNNAIMGLYSDRKKLKELKKGAVIVGERFKEKHAWTKLVSYIK